MTTGTGTSHPLSDGWLRTIALDAQQVDRTSTAERVAAILRQRVTEGDLPPGTRMSEEQLIEVLQVSRNTLREAFRLLSHQGLLVHRLHRGVFVRELDEADLVDIYHLRRVLECSVVSGLGDVPSDRLRPLRDAVEAGESAAQRADWVTVGTANLRFHAHLVALADSPRTDEVAERLLAELRLAFHAVASPQHLHEPYVSRNRSLLDLVVAGRYGAAAEALDTYLEDSQSELLEAVRATTADREPRSGAGRDEE